MKKTFLSISAFFVGSLLFVSQAEASHYDYNQNHSGGQTVNVYVNGKSTHTSSNQYSYNNNNSHHKRVPQVHYRRGFVPYVNGQYTNYKRSSTPSRQYNQTGVNYRSNDYYKTNHSRYTTADWAYANYNRNYGSSTSFVGHSGQRYTPTRPNYSHTGGSCANH